MESLTFNPLGALQFLSNSSQQCRLVHMSNLKPSSCNTMQSSQFTRLRFPRLVEPDTSRRHGHRNIHAHSVAKVGTFQSSLCFTSKASSLVSGECRRRVCSPLSKCLVGNELASVEEGAALAEVVGEGLKFDLKIGWQWTKTNQELLAYTLLLATVPIVAVLPSLQWSGAFYFLFLPVWSIYVGSHCSLGRKLLHKVSFKRGPAVPLFCSGSLFGSYCLLSSNLDLRSFISAYLGVVGAVAVTSNLVPPLRLLLPNRDKLSWHIAWGRRNSYRDFWDSSNLVTPTSCVNVCSLHSSRGNEEDRKEPAEERISCTKGEIHLSSLEEITSVNSKRLGRRDFTNLTLGFGSALLVGRWADGGSASAISTKKDTTKSPFDEKRLLDQNRRMQKLNNAPLDFPGFVREGFEVKVMTDDKYTKAQSGLIYLDLVQGNGEPPKDGQQVTFHYTGYNENGRRVDSSYQQGQPARTRLGIKGMIPGFEEGIRSMRPGGKRRIVIPPELGPPVGPSTFFSAKQFEVFDVELLEVKDCNRRTIGFYSDVVCE